MTIESGINPEENNQEYQVVEDIPLKKVSEGEVDFENAIGVNVKAESPEDIEKMVREKLKNQYWWLQEYWQEKGLPKEQVDIQVGDYKITLYNFGEPLQKRHLEELKKALDDFSIVDNGKSLRKVTYILLDDRIRQNPNTGEEQRGEAGMNAGAIIIYPKGTKFGDYRKEETENFQGVSDFEASVIHELAHRVETDFENKWKIKFNWEALEKGRMNMGGSMSFYRTTQPQKCVSDYARFSPAEDICESMVAALRKPEVLDPEKLQFIQDELLQENESLPVVMDHRESNRIELPKLEQVNYKTEKPPIKIKSRKKAE